MIVQLTLAPVILALASGIACASECTAADRVLSDAISDGVNAGRPEKAILNPCSSMYLARDSRRQGAQQDPRSDLVIKQVRAPRDTPGSIPGEAIAARQAAPPASTAPQPGLFSVLHNVER